MEVNLSYIPKRIIKMRWGRVSVTLDPLRLTLFQAINCRKRGGYYIFFVHNYFYSKLTYPHYGSDAPIPLQTI